MYAGPEDADVAQLRKLQSLFNDGAKSASQIAILLNGGATVTLLALRGTAWSPEVDSLLSIRVDSSMLIFFFGLVTATFAVTSIVSAQFKRYMQAQLKYNASSDGNIEQSADSLPKPKKYEIGWNDKPRTILMWTRISYSLFMLGAGMSCAWVFLG